MVQENTMKIHESEMLISQHEKEDASMRVEIDGLRISTEEMMNRKTALQAEIGALDKHMSCLSNTNKQLSHEMDGVVVADQEVHH